MNRQYSDILHRMLSIQGRCKATAQLAEYLNR